METAVNGLTFMVWPGTVTGFLGPNGAGKPTTIRALVGLDGHVDGVIEAPVPVTGSVRLPRHRTSSAPTARTGATFVGTSDVRMTRWWVAGRPAPIRIPSEDHK
jgi:ABC-type uncharacterized transport system ATPase subunit